MMEWWQAVILGVVEGITEFLPVSSTGHLIIASALLGLDHPEVKPAMDAFNIVIQGAAILAVVGLYWSRLIQILMGVLGRDRDGLRLFVHLLIAFFPVAILGVLLHGPIESRLFYPGPVVAALMIGGVFMMLIDRWRIRRFGGVGDDAGGLAIEQLTAGRALTVGLLQCVSLWPGTSRAMMTLAGAYLVGLRPRQAAEFSFLLGLPVLVGATCYALLQNLLEEDDAEISALPGSALELAGVGLFGLLAIILLTAGVHLLIGTPPGSKDNADTQCNTEDGASGDAQVAARGAHGMPRWLMLVAGLIATALGSGATYMVSSMLATAGKGSETNMFAVLGPASVTIGIVGTVLAAGATVKWLVAFVGRHGLTLFGGYRIVMGGAVLLLSAWGVIAIVPDEELPEAGEVPTTVEAPPEAPADSPPADAPDGSGG